MAALVRFPLSGIDPFASCSHCVIMKNPTITMKASTFTMALILTGCVDGFFGFGETGDEPDEYWCDADGACLLASPDDPRVQAAIDEGAFVPHSLGTCEEQGPTWETLRRLDPIVSNVPPLRAAFCGDMGYDGPTTPTETFAVCLPAIPAWEADGLVGAIGRFSASVWLPHCDEIEPFAFTHDYVFSAKCFEGTSCLGWRDECGCKCAESSAQCGDTQWDLSASHFGDEYALSEWGWDLACTGYPWTFQQQSDSWVGSTCEWNQPSPQPGELPHPLQDALDVVACRGSSCSVPPSLVDDLLASPGAVGGSSDVELSSVVTITQCNHLCASLGLRVGDAIVSVGLGHVPATNPLAWPAALDELRDGGTEALIRTPMGTYTLTLILDTDEA